MSAENAENAGSAENVVPSAVPGDAGFSALTAFYSFLLASRAELLFNCGVPNEKGTDSWRTLSTSGGANQLG